MPASVTVDAADSASQSSRSISINGVPDSPAAADGDSPFPQLHNNGAGDDFQVHPLPGTANQAPTAEDDNDGDEPAVAKPFQRHYSPARHVADDSAPARDHGSTRRDCFAQKMHKLSVYETASRYYIVGGDITEKRFRILKIDRSSEDSDLSITDDKIVYSRKEMNQLLDTIDDGNRGTGGIKLRCTGWGLMGFIRFTGAYYMLLITKKSTVAVVCGHFIYQIEGTQLIPLTPTRIKADQRNSEEARFLSILQNLDLTRSFYYSYYYDITRTLQYNITRERTALLKDGEPFAFDSDFDSMFLWNTHLLQPAIKGLTSPFDWCRPVIHGYIDQAAIDMYGKKAYVTIIARRSRYFAGARFLKRGVNDLGYVANDVETEQIVSEGNTTSFHAPGPKLYTSPSYTSYVQHRGSIPLHWTQDNTGVAPKPPIVLNLPDPFYSAAALHFDNLFKRYGAPIFALNLVKARERTPRESTLLVELTSCIKYLNQFLPEGQKITHRAFDMSRAAKSRDLDVIGTLEGIAETVMATTDFFHNGDGDVSPVRMQNGVARTNCIDCLDRTNAAQFVIGKAALGHQLHALGMLEGTSVAFETDTMNLLTHMYHDHGDTIAVQYGGSQLVNTMETYRKVNQWTSHSRDMIESFKRYYNNSFMDAQRQEAYNLFLGNYIFTQGQPMLWDLASDAHLHQSDPRAWKDKVQPDYIHWFTPKYLEKRTMPSYVPLRGDAAKKPISYFDDYWLEYYRPFAVSSAFKMFAYKMRSTLKIIPLKSSNYNRYDLSPFKVRTEGDSEAQARKKAKKEVTILIPQDVAKATNDDDAASIMSGRSAVAVRGIRSWLQSYPDRVTSGMSGILKEGTPALGDEVYQPKVKVSTLEKTREAQWTFTQMVEKSLTPSVDRVEKDQYSRYVSHPQNLRIVVSAEISDGEDNEYRAYINRNWQAEGQVLGGADEDAAVYSELLKVGENPLTVTEEDTQKKRYKAYGKWLRGKPLFKHQPVD